MLPALALMPQCPRRHDVFPLDAPSSNRIFPRLELATRELDDRFDVLAAAVKVLFHPGENVRQDFFSIAEVTMPNDLLAVDELEHRTRGRLRRPRFRFSGLGRWRKQIG